MMQGFTYEEWDQLLRLNETDPQEAVRRLLLGISDPKVRKSRYPVIKLDSREYNLVVSVHESGDKVACANLLLNLCKCPHEARQDITGIFQFPMFRPEAVMDPRFKVSVYAKFINQSIFPLNPVAADDRETGEYPDIESFNVYEGPVFLPYLLAWIASGHIQMLGV